MALSADFYDKLLKNFNRKNTQKRLDKSHLLFLENKISYDKIYESMQGSFAYMRYADVNKFKSRMTRQMGEYFKGQISSLEIDRWLRA